MSEPIITRDIKDYFHFFYLSESFFLLPSQNHKSESGIFIDNLNKHPLMTIFMTYPFQSIRIKEVISSDEHEQDTIPDKPETTCSLISIIN
ncbi:hypothetical protein DRQ07_05180 [candidate division KSB1 bacterium]|nr:MAG: hypothetical protein DRQ07_05180 [candidate division KSB1 bacterium]